MPIDGDESHNDLHAEETHIDVSKAKGMQDSPFFLQGDEDSLHAHDGKGSGSSFKNHEDRKPDYGAFEWANQGKRSAHMEKELEKMAEELGVGAFAPKEPKDDRSLFGDTEADKVSKSNSGMMTDKEWHNKKMPLPVFYNSHEVGLVMLSKDLTDVDGIEWSKDNPPLEIPTFYSTQSTAN